MKTIKIQTIRHYTRTAVVEIPLPDNMAFDEVPDFLYDNDEVYRQRMDNLLSEAEEECDFQSDQTRFDIVESITLTKQLWGGTL